ncbi:MAG: hypothetical protein RLZ29_1166 [Actinomycetota bacterium]
MIADFFTTFGLVFLAELPDKTMFATLLLASRLQRRSAVWAGVTTAYSLHVAVAVLLGGLLARLPEEPVRYGIAVLFMLAGAYVMWTSWRDDDDHDAEVANEATRSWRSTFGVSMATIGVAEFADITQFATASLAATREHPLFVGLGAVGALASVSGLAVLVGAALVKRLNVRLIQRAAGALFIMIGVATFV